MGLMPVATVQNQTTGQASTADHLNTPRQLTSADGTLLWQWPYSAFGDEPPQVADKHFAMLPAAEGDFEFNLRYPGQYFDKESGLHYNGHRTCDPRTGRYTQADPIGLEGGWNRFVHAGGNPLSFSDSTGLNPMAEGVAGARVGSAFGPVGTVLGGVVGAEVGTATGCSVVGPLFQSEPMMWNSLSPGFWPAGRGAEEWGRRNDVGSKEGQRQFH